MSRIRNIFFLVSALSAGPALADDLKFSLVNNSDYVIDEFYASPANIDEWGDDILGQDTLDAGGTGTVTMQGGGDVCLYDVKVVDEEEAEHVLEDVDLCTLNEVTFTK